MTIKASKPADLGHKIVQHQEVAFSICMALVAVLGQGNPLIDYPQILWTFAALLAFNLIYHVLLRRPNSHWVVPFISIAVNILVISAIIAYSGESDSQFWPMYLLPIFTSCLYMEGWHIFFTVIACAGFLTYFYLEFLWIGLFWNSLELLVKLAVLGLSAGITSRVSFSEREAQAGLVRSREELDHLTKTLSQKNTPNQWIDGILHSVNNGLMVISGTVELMMSENPSPESERRADLQRIQSAAHSLAALTTTLLSWSKKGIPELKPISIDEILSPILTLMDYRIKRKGLHLSKTIPGNLPLLKWNPVLLQQVFSALLNEAVEYSASAAPMEIKSELHEKNIEVHLNIRSQSPAASTLGIRPLKDLLGLQGGNITQNRFDTSLKIVVSLPQNPEPVKF